MPAGAIVVCTIVTRVSVAVLHIFLLARRLCACLCTVLYGRCGRWQRWMWLRSHAEPRCRYGMRSNGSFFRSLLLCILSGFCLCSRFVICVVSSLKSRWIAARKPSMRIYIFFCLPSFHHKWLKPISLRPLRWFPLLAHSRIHIHISDNIVFNFMFYPLVVNEYRKCVYLCRKPHIHVWYWYLTIVSEYECVFCMFC